MPQNIKDELTQLVQLQDLDTQIYALKKEKSGQPQLLEEIQLSLEAFKSKLKSLEETRQKQQLRQKEKELELGTKEEAIKKSQAQLGQLKTNKDYQAKLTEIESFKADKSLIEEDILRLMDDLDMARLAIEEEKKIVAKEEQSSGEKKNKIEARTKDIQSQLELLEGKRKILAGSIDKKSLSYYDHVLAGKDGLALVKVQNNSCQGCNMHVPPQVINEIKMYDRLITCEMCARILYLEEDVRF